MYFSKMWVEGANCLKKVAIQNCPVSLVTFLILLEIKH